MNLPPLVSTGQRVSAYARSRPLRKAYRRLGGTKASCSAAAAAQRVLPAPLCMWPAAGGGPPPSRPESVGHGPVSSCLALAPAVRVRLGFFSGSSDDPKLPGHCHIGPGAGPRGLDHYNLLDSASSLRES
eukprot:1280620-Rhodomonas_salina.1